MTDSLLSVCLSNWIRLIVARGRIKFRLRGRKEDEDLSPKWEPLQYGNSGFEFMNNNKRLEEIGLLRYQKAENLTRLILFIDGLIFLLRKITFEDKLPKT